MPTAGRIGPAASLRCPRRWPRTRTRTRHGQIARSRRYERQAVALRRPTCSSAAACPANRTPCEANGRAATRLLPDSGLPRTRASAATRAGCAVPEAFEKSGRPPATRPPDSGAAAPRGAGELRRPTGGDRDTTARLLPRPRRSPTPSRTKARLAAARRDKLRLEPGGARASRRACSAGCSACGAAPRGDPSARHASRASQRAKGSAVADGPAISWTPGRRRHPLRRRLREGGSASRSDRLGALRPPRRRRGPVRYRGRREFALSSSRARQVGHGPLGSRPFDGRPSARSASSASTCAARRRALRSVRGARSR